MPPGLKNGQGLFLGLELATDQFRAAIVDESLELVGVECVDFDRELPEYQTQGGIFTSPGDAFTTPVEMWIKGLDILLDKLSRSHDLARIRSIGGAAQHALVWWKSTTVPSLSSLDPNLFLYNHFPSQSFSLPNTPTVQDTSSHTHALAIEALLGGPDRMVERVGTCANPSLTAGQLLRVRETWPQEVWARTGRIQLASAFLASLISGKWLGMSETEACATGMWVHGTNNTPQPGAQSFWDEGVLDIVGGSREEGRRVRGWLGDVDVSGGGRRPGNVSKYLVERYGFEPDTIVTPFTSDHLSAYLSLLPSPNDAVLSFGPLDTLMTPAQHYHPTRLYNLYPHPAQDSGEKRKYIAVLSSRNADVSRALVRDMYTKSWSAFDRLVAIVPPGGSIGLDDKLFSFWHLQGDCYPFSHLKGIFRFETGVKVNEFRDLRANPRCLIESQILSFRVNWSRMCSLGLLGLARKGGVSPTPSSTTSRFLSNPVAAGLGISFDPYEYGSLPSRILTTGAAANFPSVANLVGDVFNAPVFVPATQVDSATQTPHRNAPANGFPSRAALGGSYIARWIWGRETGVGGLSVFEDEMKRLLTKRWVATGGVPLRTQVNGAMAGSSGAINSGGNLTSSGGNSGASTPYGHGPRTGLGATVFVEEEEDELEQEKDSNSKEHEICHEYRFANSSSGLGVIGSGIYSGSTTSIPPSPGANSFGDIGFGSSRLRTQTSSSLDSTLTSATSNFAPSTAFTTPDLNLGNATVMGPSVTVNGNTTPSSASATTPTTPAPLTPVVALPTADAEAQIGLAKVAEADLDAFMSYASIVPEYCRLEGILVKGIV